MDRRASLKWVFPVSLSFGALLAGCGGATPPAETSKSPAVPAEVVAESDGHGKTPAEPKPAEGGVGLAHKDNDKAMVEAAKKLLECKWESKGWLPDCKEPKEAWRKIDVDAKGATLVHFLEDKDERVVYLGASGLSSARDWRTDKALAATVLDVFEKSPKNEMFSSALASALGRIDVVATGNEERVKKLIVGYPDEELRAEVISSVQFSNRDVYFDTVLGLAKTAKEERIRNAALSSFWTGTPNGKNEAVCALWLEKTKDESEEVAIKASYLAGFNSRGCPKEYDALVKLFDEKTKGKLESNNWSINLKYMAGNDQVPEKNRKALAAIGKRIAEKKDNSASARVDGIRTVVAADTKGGKAYAAKFKNDKEKWVKEAAEEIIAQKDN